MKRALPLFLILVITLSCSQNTDQGTVQSEKQVISLASPPDSLTVFGISTQHNERDFTLSPDGSEFYYTIVAPNGMSAIAYRRLEGDEWSDPQIASFSGKYKDLEAAFSPDGTKLYFASNRPTENNPEKADYDIWMVQRDESGWGAPENVGETVNTPGNEFYPSVTSNGDLYYTATLENGIGREDIFIARFNGSGYDPPVVLDTAVNSASFEFNAYVLPDESALIFSSFGRPDGKGGGDLYISLRDDEGNWQPAVNMSELNTDRLDYCPFVSFDGSLLFISSNRSTFDSGKQLSMADLSEMIESPGNGDGDIYWVSWNSILSKYKP